MSAVVCYRYYFHLRDVCGPKRWLWVGATRARSTLPGGHAHSTAGCAPVPRPPPCTSPLTNTNGNHRRTALCLRQEPHANEAYCERSVRMCYATLAMGSLMTVHTHTQASAQFLYNELPLRIAGRLHDYRSVRCIAYSTAMSSHCSIA